MRFNLLSILALVAGLGFFSAPAHAQAPQPTLYNIVDTFGGYDSLAKAVEIAGLVEALDGPDSLTLYAPTDAAFVALPAATREALFADSAALRDILLYHVRAGAQVIPETPVGLSFAPTLNGVSLQLIRVEGGVEGPAGDSLLVADSVGVEIDDVYARNGIFNAIGQILLPPNVVDVAVASPVHNTFVGALFEADLVDDLGGGGPFTVFAPTDAAFDTLYEQDIFGALLENPDTLQRILTYHVVAGALTSADFTDGDSLVTLSGDTLGVQVTTAGAVFVDGTPVAIADVVATNGVVHVIGEVLIPDAVRPLPRPTTVFDVIATSDIHNTLEAAIAATDLQGDLDDAAETYTVFAPDDEAFGDLPAGALDSLLDDSEGLTDLLSYHVVAGDFPASQLTDGDELVSLRGDTLSITVNTNGTFVEGVLVEVADLMADNGFVHSIGAVLMPPAQPADTTERDTTTSVVEVIAGRDDLVTLTTAIETAGLAGALDDSTAAFTVFAPADSAFANLSEGVLDSLLDDPEGLADLLRYHVVAGTLTAADLMDGMELPTLQGDTLTVSVTAGGVFVDAAAVTTPDLLADNGVVHVIDAVLVPTASPSDSTDGGGMDSTAQTAFGVIEASEIHTTLEAVLVSSGLDAALDDSTAMLTVFAPTDAAFAALDQETLANLLADSTGQLADLLRYHVVSGVLTSDSLLDRRQLVTLSGDTLDVTVDAGGGISVGGVAIATADLEASNGVVHVIGGVLVPEGFFTGTIESAADAGFRVYPTLTTGAVRIEAPRGERVRSVMAVDLSGRAINLIPTGDVLDLSAMAPGHYFLVLDTDGGRYSSRVVRTR